jgi:hypothetical protein
VLTSLTKQRGKFTMVTTARANAALFPLDAVAAANDYSTLFNSVAIVYP